ncbi:hypothetical protein [Mycobacterium sp. NPDC050853]|uniref:hypothetical protein n=1 Tax=Mycobacterium sp. NPDC050853 TaxID=3155160 RepID=UPI0033D4EF7F
MDTARVRGGDPTKQVAAQLLRSWDPKVVAATQFYCWSCPVRVFPKAYEPKRRVQAYFSLYDGEPHAPDCEGVTPVAAANESGGLAVGAVPTEVYWPSRLLDRPAERTVLDEDGGLAPAQDRRHSTRSSTAGGSGSALSRSGRVYSILPFAVAFWQMSRSQREQAHIDLPAITDADRYAYAFKQLPTWEVLTLKYPRRVFYAKLRWTSPLDDDGRAFKVALHAGDWDADTKIFHQQWQFRVDHTQWTPQARSKFRKEIDRAVQIAREKHWVPWVFALATQSRMQPWICEVDQRAHIAVIAVDADNMVR